MSTTLSVLFYARKSKLNALGETPIYMRVTIDGQRLDIGTKRFIHPDQWSAEAGIAKGKTEAVREINSFLDSLKMKAYFHQKELLQEGNAVTMDFFKAKWFGREVESGRMLMEIFTDHNDKMKALIGTEFAPLTHERYVTSKKHTQEFMKWKYGFDDIDIKKINYEFISEYEFWLKSVRKCDHNTTVKYLSNFRKIINICLKHGWLDKDPFVGFKMTKREVEKSFLSQEEIERIEQKVFSAERVNNVKDIFLFSCYTGLAYADVLKLSRKEIMIGMDGDQWIFTRRQKTETATRIPLLPPAIRILEKYSDHPQCVNQDRLLPVLSNQKMNSYLKEIADQCEIKKKMTFHIARHTFATTVTLTNGVPIETVSKMLGHRNLKTTQHYAKILDRKVSEDMMALKSKYLKSGVTAANTTETSSQ